MPDRPWDNPPGTDQPDPVARGAASEVVAEVLAASPQWDSLVFTGTTLDQVSGRRNPTWSPTDHPDALSAVARQAGAAIRKAAALMPEQWSHEHAVAWLRALADEIDGGTDGT